jgi:hypothetical protein
MQRILLRPAISDFSRERTIADDFNTALRCFRSGDVDPGADRRRHVVTGSRLPFLDRVGRRSPGDGRCHLPNKHPRVLPDPPG